MATSPNNQFGPGSGLYEGPGATWARSFGNREELTRYFWTLDDPWDVTPREGARDYRFSRMRLDRCEITHNSQSISFIVCHYIDQTTYNEKLGARYPRGLVRIGSAIQTGNAIIRARFDESIEYSVPIVYRATTRTYLSYHNLPDSRLSREASAPPGAQPADGEVIYKDVTGFAPWARPYVEAIAEIKTEWKLLQYDATENGGYWTVSETYGGLQVPYVIYA